MLYLVGLGLGDERDITLRGLDVVKECDEVWLETYTSILGVSRQKLEALYERPVLEASRETVESESDEILRNVETKDVAVLVVGDPLCATTHTDLALRAKRRTKVAFVQNASVMAAVARCGLQLYRFGTTVSIPYERSTSFLDGVRANLERGAHTLCLLDIKTREPDFEVLAKTGRTVYLPPRFMSVNEAIQQILDIDGSFGDFRGVGLARLGQDSERIKAGTLTELLQLDFGPPLHSLVICAHELHELETEFLQSLP